MQSGVGEIPVDQQELTKYAWCGVNERDAERVENAFSDFEVRRSEA